MEKTKKIVKWFVWKKITLLRKEKKMINPYSPKKRNTKKIEEYSVLNPLTNSDSPSVRSNGARFVSARIDKTQIGKSGRANKIEILGRWGKWVSKVLTSKDLKVKRGIIRKKKKITS